MSEIREYCIDDPESWDRAVHSFPDYEVFYLAGYVRAFQLENPENGEPVLVLYENGEDRAVQVFFRRDVAGEEKLRGKVPSGRYYDIITPYGYGGFHGSVRDWDALNRAYAGYCREKGYVCEFVRFDLFSDYAAHYAGQTESRTHNVVRDLALPMDQMWMDFKQKVRKNVKRAQNYQLQVLAETDGCHLDDFLRIYYGTMDRTSAEKQFFFSREFFERLSQMRDNAVFFHVVYQGQIISTELVIYGAQNAYSYLGGTDSRFFDLRPNDFLKVEIIRWAQEKGLKRFILGGGYGTDDGIFQYKLSFAPHGVRDFYIGRNIFDQKAYDLLVSLREGQELNEHFFPLYRS